MKRKYLWWGLGTLVVVVIVVVAAGPWAYSKWIAGDADDELALPSSTQAASEASTERGPSSPGHLPRQHGPKRAIASTKPCAGNRLRSTAALHR